ncbi:branched-chain amino acid ABC transporter permease [Chloroflexota bacterium]
MRQRLKDIDWIGLVLWVFRAVIIILMIWGTVATLISKDNPLTGREFLGFLVDGISQGSLYALIALGYTLVYGILFMINFAHGEFFMSGAMTATVFVALPLSYSGFLDAYPVPGLLLCGLVAAITSVCVALLTERIAYRPLRKAPRLIPLITAIGASFFWQYFFRGLYGGQIVPFPEIEPLTGSVAFFGVEILRKQIVVIVASVVMLISLYFFVMRTKQGKAMRAVAEDKDVAALMGIDVDRVITITFAVGAAMAGAAGVMYGLLFRQTGFAMGFIPGIKAFTAAVLGGIGSVPGAAVGGLLLGIFESVGPRVFLQGVGIPASYQLRDVIAFVMLVVVLIFRPQGILGERLTEKKA